MRPWLMLRRHSLNFVLNLIEPMNYSINAIKMLGDMLTEQEERINDANPACDQQLERDLEAVNELWELYQSLMQ